MTLQFSGRLRTLFVALLQFSVVFSLFAARAYSGTLDPTFGTGGKVTVDFPFTNSPNYDSYGKFVFVQPSGRIVGVGAHRQPGGDGMATGVALVGLTPSGAIDATFASGGKALDWGTASLVGLSDAQMLSDGKILRLSQFIQLFGPITVYLKRTEVNGFEESFSPNLNVESYPLPGKFAVQRDGKILVIIKSSTSTNRHYLVRLNVDGSRDATFGADGVKEIPRISGVPDLHAVSMQMLANGKILIAGNIGYSTTTFDYNEIFLLRLDSDANVDRTFGRLGLVRQTFGGQRIFATELIVQSDNKYLIAGLIKNPDRDALMVRFTQRGRLDFGFGASGMVVTDFSPGSDDYLNGADVASDGKIIAAGSAFLPPSTFSNFLVARYAPNGTLEAHTQTAFTPSQNSLANHVLIQPDGKILVIGHTGNPNAAVNGNVFAFARYTSITND